MRGPIAAKLRSVSINTNPPVQKKRDTGFADRCSVCRSDAVRIALSDVVRLNMHSYINTGR